MILKGYKEKSIQKFINKLVDSRDNILSNNKIESIAVLLNLSEFDDFEAFRNLFKTLNINPIKIKIFAFTHDPKMIEGSWERLYSNKQIGWNGKIKDNELETFVNTDFDVLISYYQASNYELSLVTAASKANFKIGLSNKDERLNDLILNINPKEFNLFKQELLKYLTILHKI